MRLVRPLLVLLLAAFALAAASPARRDWSTAVAQTPAGGHLYGNPAAPLKLVEYISYTCPHCARFQQQGGEPLRTSYVAPGKVSVEIRHLVRDPIDLTAAMLANCGDPEKFLHNHDALLVGQDKWMQVLQNSTDTQRKRWDTGTLTERMRSIAADFGFYAIMARNGYARPAADRCLGDAAMVKRLTDQTAQSERLGIDSTPSFLLNGVLLAGTHDWPSLEAQLQARL